MATAFENVARLFRNGDYAELVDTTPRTIAGLKSLSPNERCVIALAHALSGDPDRAELIAALEVPSQRDHSVLAQMQMARGVAAEAKRQPEAALEHLRAACRSAEASGDAELTAWSHLRLLRLIIELDPTNSVAQLPEVRLAVLRAGSHHATAYLHLLVTVIEGRNGRVGEATRHLQITESLLDSVPNEWLRFGTLMNRGAISCVEGDFVEATAWLRRAKAHAERIKQPRAILHAEVQLGYLLTLRGAFDKAGPLLRATAGSQQIAGRVHASILECLSRLSLAQNLHSECDSALRDLESRGLHPAGSLSAYEFRWAAITRARLFLKQGQPEEALAHLHRAASEASGAKDVPFDCALQITAAQAHVRRQRHAEAAQCLAAATRLGVTGFRELLGAYYQAAAETTVDDGVADVLRNRASRVWSTQGIVSVPLEMQSPLPDRRLQAPAPAASPLTVIERLAGAVDLAYSPALIGDELLAVLEALGVADARLVERPATAAPLSTDRQLVMPLGPARRTNGHVYLTCSLPADSARALAVTNVLRIGATAVEAERARQEQRERTALWPADPLEGEVNGLFIAEEMQTLLAMARKIAGTTVAVLITGETGTGKEVLARAIHAYSSRSKQLFLPFNCASMPKEMLDSQLFGHRRGAFTGAAEHFPGVIRAASGGTLFLDEIGDLGLDVQPKLLRFLESGEVHPIGEAQPVSTNVRVIAATNVELESLVSSGRFREDLFYRLNIVRLHVPPLRERRVEIPALAHHYLQRYGREWGKGDLRLSEETIEYLTLYRWPGNVRQLANEMRRIAVIAEPGAVLTPQCLSPDVLAARRTVPASERTLEPCEMVVRLDQPMTAATEQVERAMLEFALRKCQGRMEDTAAMLGLSRKGLYLKRHRFGIESPAPTLSADGR